MAKKKKSKKENTQKTRKNMKKKYEIIITLLVFAVIFFCCSCPFPIPIDYTLTANVYKNGDFVDTTTVTIQGEKISRFRGKHEFYGTFAIDCIPETCIPGTNAEIIWPRHLQQQITYYNPGHHPDDTNVIITADGDLKFIHTHNEISPDTDIIDIAIARNMTEFVILQKQPYGGNCVISTSENTLRRVAEQRPHFYEDYLTESQKETLLSSNE